jgi:hypothetical protein
MDSGPPLATMANPSKRRRASSRRRFDVSGREDVRGAARPVEAGRQEA